MILPDLLVNLFDVVGSSPRHDTELVTAIEIASGIFALALLIVSLYGWYRRRHSSLLIIAVAFLVYFLNIMIDALQPFIGMTSELVVAVLNFVILALIFLALLIGSGRKRLVPPKNTSDNS